MKITRANKLRIESVFLKIFYLHSWLFTECSLDMSESGKTLAYMTHYWGSKDSSLSKCT